MTGTTLNRSGIEMIKKGETAHLAVIVINGILTTKNPDAPYTHESIMPDEEWLQGIGGKENEIPACNAVASLPSLYDTWTKTGPRTTHH